MSADLFNTSSIRWVTVINMDTDPVPPFGVMAIQEVDNQGNFQVARPTQDSQQGLLFNGPMAIPAGMEGQAHCNFPAIIAYDDGGADANAPQNGQIWGAGANSWYLQAGKNGLMFAGGGQGGLGNWLPQGPTPGATIIKILSAQPFIALLPGGRQVADGTLTSGSPNFSSPTAAFTSADIGKEVIASNIPLGTTIISVISGTAVVMSKAATSGGSANVMAIGGYIVYDSDIETWATPTTGAWTSSATAVWFRGLNNERPVVGARYSCEALGADVNGTAIYTAAVIKGQMVRCTQANPVFIRQYNNSPITSPNFQLTAGQPDLTNASSFWTSGNVGQYVIGPGIPLGTFIQSFISGTHVVLSQNATATGNHLALYLSVSALGFQGVPQGFFGNTTVGAQNFGGFYDIDARNVFDGVVTKGSTTIQSASAYFNSNDIGKAVVVPPQTGPSSVMWLPPNVTITAIISATQATISAPALQTASFLELDIHKPVWLVPDTPVSGTILEKCGQLPFVGRRYNTVNIGDDVNGVPIFAIQVTEELCNFAVASSVNGAFSDFSGGYPSKVMLQGRLVKDAVTNGTTTLTSATANFTAADVGSAVWGSSNIDGNSSAFSQPQVMTIVAFVNSTTVTLSQAASGSGSGLTCYIANRWTYAYWSNCQLFNNGIPASNTNHWSNSTAVGYMVPVNSQQQTQIPGFGSASLNFEYMQMIRGFTPYQFRTYQARYVGIDWAGVPVFTFQLEQAEFIIWVNPTPPNAKVSINILSTRASIDAYPCQILAYEPTLGLYFSDGAGPLGINAPSGYWTHVPNFQFCSSDIAPPVTPIRAKQVDVTTDGKPVFACCGNSTVMWTPRDAGFAAADYTAGAQNFCVTTYSGDANGKSQAIMLRPSPSALNSFFPYGLTGLAGPTFGGITGFPGPIIQMDASNIGSRDIMMQGLIASNAIAGGAFGGPIFWAFGSSFFNGQGIQRIMMLCSQGGSLPSFAVQSNVPNDPCVGQWADFSINDVLMGCVINLSFRGGLFTKAQAGNMTNFPPVPANSASTGNPGQIAMDDSFFYYCFSPNTWRRIAGSAF